MTLTFEQWMEQEAQLTGMNPVIGGTAALGHVAEAAHGGQAGLMGSINNLSSEWEIFNQNEAYMGQPDYGAAVDWNVPQPQYNYTPPAPVANPYAEIVAPTFTRTYDASGPMSQQAPSFDRDPMWNQQEEWDAVYGDPVAPGGGLNAAGRAIIGMDTPADLIGTDTPFTRSQPIDPFAAAVRGINAVSDFVDRTPITAAAPGLNILANRLGLDVPTTGEVVDEYRNRAIDAAGLSARYGLVGGGLLPENVARGAADLFLPRSTLEVGLELLPGIGTVPDLMRGMDTAQTSVRALNGLPNVPLTRNPLIEVPHYSDEMADLARRTDNIAGITPVSASMPTRNVSQLPFGTQMAGGADETIRGVDDYAMQHRPPGPGRGGAPLHDLTGGGEVYPDDIYSPQAVRYYGTGDAPLDRQTIAILQRLKDNPDATVTIYRAVPDDVAGEITAGDWVTVNRNYAQIHGEGPLQGKYRIISKEVTAKDVFTNGDSIHEAGYFPQSSSGTTPPNAVFNRMRPNSPSPVGPRPPMEEGPQPRLPSRGTADVAAAVPGGAGGSPSASPASPPSPPSPPVPPTGALPEPSSPLDSVRIKFLAAAQQEQNMRRTGAVGREIRQGRSAQAAGIRQGLEAGGTLEEVTAAVRQGSYQGGTLRKTTLLQPIALTADEQVAMLDELGRLVTTNEISPFDLLRFVEPGDAAQPGILAKLQSETPRLQPNEIRLIRKAFGDEFAEAVAKRSSDSAEPMMTRAQELAEMARADRIEAQQIAKAQKAAAQEEQRLTALTTRLQERMDSRDFRQMALEADRERRRIQNLVEAGQRADQRQLARIAREGRPSPEATNRLIARFDEAQARFAKQLEDAKIKAQQAMIRADELEIAQTRRYNEQSIARQEKAMAREALAADRAEARAIEQALAKQSPSVDMLLQRARGEMGDILAGMNKTNIEAGTDEALEILRQHLTNNQAILDGLHDAEGWRQYVGAVRAVATGELGDSYLTELMHRNHSLGSALMSNGVDPQVARKVADLVQQAELQRRFPEGIPQRVTDELATMKGAPYNESLKGLELAVQRWKNTAFGIDAGIFGVQGLAAIRRGGVPGVVGLVNRTLGMLNLPHVSTHMADAVLSKRIRNTLDGIQYGSGSAGLQPDAGTMLMYLGTPGKKADSLVTPLLQKASDLQFDNVMGWVGDNVYEGNLVMLHLLGRDINNPVTRAAAAESANTIKSFARQALRSKRSGLERILLTSPAMTRSQISNLLQMAKVFNPKASADERILGAGMIASQAIFYLTVGKFLNDKVGVTDFIMDPSIPGFGLITLDEKDSQGRNRVIDLFPQASVDRAIARSFRELAEGDEDKALNTWLRYFSGRSSPTGRLLLGVGGIGYRAGGSGGFSRELSARDRFLNLVPVPPIVNSALEQRAEGTPDAIESLLTFGGISNFGESTWGSEDRFAQQVFGSDYRDLTPDQQAAVHITMREQGVTLTDKEAAAPFIYAASSALDIRQEQILADPAMKARSDEFLNAIGEPDYDITQYQSYTQAKVAFVERVMKWNGGDRKLAEKAWTDYVNKGLELDDLKKQMQQDAVERDPEIAKAVIRLYNSGDISELEFAPAKWVYEAAQEVEPAE